MSEQQFFESDAFITETASGIHPFQGPTFKKGGQVTYKQIYNQGKLLIGMEIFLDGELFWCLHFK